MTEPPRDPPAAPPGPTLPEEAPPSALSLLLQGQRRRWQEGDPVLVETYLQEHPSL